MKTNQTLQEKITDIYYSDGENYEAEEGHNISETEKTAWVTDILSVAEFAPSSRVLDVGCGTGALTEMLLGWGCEVTGLDAAEPMLQSAKGKLSSMFEGKVNFVLGDSHQNDLFKSETFDWITARQVVCHFYDPLGAFKSWHSWLKPNGKIMIIEGFWQREGWNNEELVDQLPLSCHQSKALISYLLEQSGFQVETSQWLKRVNNYFSEDGKSGSIRYLVIAKKS